MDDDDLKHLDTHSDEIRELVDGIIQQHLVQVATDGKLCPKCVAVTLLEWASFAATSAGATVAEILNAAANGAVSAEEEAELLDSEPPSHTRH